MGETLFKVTKYNNPLTAEDVGLMEAMGNADNEFEAHSLSYKLIASSQLMEKKLLPSEAEGGQVSYGPLTDFNGKKFRLDLAETLSDGKEILCRFLSAGEKLADGEAEFLTAFAADDMIQTIYVAYEDLLSEQDQDFFGILKIYHPEKIKLSHIVVPNS